MGGAWAGELGSFLKQLMEMCSEKNLPSSPKEKEATPLSSPQTHSEELKELIWQREGAQKSQFFSSPSLLVT